MTAKIVVIGAGYAGVRIARDLAERIRDAHREGDIRLTLVSATDHHTIKTELHRIAAGSIDDPGAVSLPLDDLFEGLPVELAAGRVAAIEPEKDLVTLSDGAQIPYDHLVIALGASPKYFGVPGMAEHSLTLGGIDSALAIRRRVDDLVRSPAALDRSIPARILIGGGGLTGVELAGELAWVLTHRYTRSAAARHVKVTLVEGAPTLMPGLHPKLGLWAEERLTRMGVEVITGAPMRSVTANRATLRRAGEEEFTVEYDLLVWSGGVRGNVLLESVFETDRKGRVVVDKAFRVRSHPNVRVLGDTACVLDADGEPVAPTAQAAVLQAEWLADALWDEIGPGRAHPRSWARMNVRFRLRPYTGKSKGLLASVGPEYGIGLLGTHPVRGRWVKWLKEANNLRYLRSIGALKRRARSIKRTDVRRFIAHSVLHTQCRKERAPSTQKYDMHSSREGSGAT